VVNSDGTSAKGGVVNSDGTSAKGGVVNSDQRRVFPWSVARDPAKLLVEAARVHEASAQRGIEDRAPAEERQHGIADPRTVDVAFRRNAVRCSKLARYRLRREPQGARDFSDGARAARGVEKELARATYEGGNARIGVQLVCSPKQASQVFDSLGGLRVVWRLRGARDMPQLGRELQRSREPNASLSYVGKAKAKQ